MDDEDEQEMYQRRLKKNLCELKVRDLSILQVQGVFTADESKSESKIYVQITENPKIEE